MEKSPTELLALLHGSKSSCSSSPVRRTFGKRRMHDGHCRHSAFSRQRVSRIRIWTQQQQQQQLDGCGCKTRQKSVFVVFARWESHPCLEFAGSLCGFIAGRRRARGRLERDMKKLRRRWQSMGTWKEERETCFLNNAHQRSSRQLLLPFHLLHTYTY